MKTLAFALGLLAAAGSAAAAAPDYDGVGRTEPPAACPSSAPKPAAEVAPDRRPEPRRLDRLPPAAHVLTVLKSVGGCPVATLKVGRQTYDVPLPSVRRPTPAGETTRMR